MPRTMTRARGEMHRGATSHRRIRRIFLALLLATAIGFVHTTTAAAATAVVEPTDIFFRIDTLRYIADAGEANSVTITPATTGAALEITDTGATITAGPGCASLAPNVVRCVHESGFIEVALRDGDDALSLSRVLLERAVFRGQAGDDTMITGGGSDSLERLLGGPGDDTLKGRAGNDVLNGGPGADMLSGGTSLQFLGLRIFDPNIDIVTYARRTNDVFADPDSIADDGEAGEGDMLEGDFELIIGGAGNDVLVGTTARGRIRGEVVLRGSILKGRRGNDVLSGARASDTLIGAGGNDVLRGHGGGDSIRAGVGNDLLIGGRGNDFLAGNPGRDLIRAGVGNDRLVGGRGRDELRGGAGKDLLLARDGRADFVNGGASMDRAQIDEGLDRIRRVETILS